MDTFIMIMQLLIGVLLVGAILIQSSKGGLGSAFGGGGEFRTKRGAEMIVFKATIVLAVLFFIASLLSVLV